MALRNSYRSPHVDATDPDKRYGLTETAPSAAWLAAQQAFAALEPKHADATPVVVVRKSRVLVAAQGVADAGDAGGLAETASAAVKTPRVFRIENAGIKGAADNEPTCSDSATSAAASSDRMKQQRRRRRRAVQAPGPVLQHHRPPALVDPGIANPGISNSNGELRLSLAQIAVLSSKLGQVGRTLEQVRAAADFELVDPAEAQAWIAFRTDLRRIRNVADRLAEHFAD